MALLPTSSVPPGVSASVQGAQASASPIHAHRRFSVPVSALAVLIVGLLLRASPAEALPSFATQTGLPCTSCHVVGFGPALTAYGRQFKLNGYTFGGGSSFMPLAAFVQLGFTHTATEQPAPPAPGFGADNDFSLDQVSAFYGGRIAPNVGAFVQVLISVTSAACPPALPICESGARRPIVHRRAPSAQRRPVRRGGPRDPLRD
jgi:hypothetical protein